MVLECRGLWRWGIERILAVGRPGGQHEAEIVRAGRLRKRILEADPASLHVSVERLVERLHTVEVALADHIPQTDRVFGAGQQIARAGGHDQDLRGDDPALAIGRRHQAL
jgi:hypothetical protein